MEKMAQYKYNNINTIKQQAIVRKGEFKSFVIQVFESANEWHGFFLWTWAYTILLLMNQQ